MKSSVIIKGVTLVAALSVLGRGASARWLSPDPLWHTLGKEALERPFEAANPYTYAGNNPINATDPSGLCPWCLVGLGAAALLFIQNDVDANIAPAIALTPPGALAVGTGMFADATDQIGQLDRQRAALLAAGNTGPASEARLGALDAGIREAGAQAFFGLATAGVGAGPLRGAGATETVPLWSSTRRLTNVENAFRHYVKHGAEFPGIQNAKQYVEGARSFVTSPPAGTLTRVGASGDTLFYHAPSNTFAVRATDGVIRTMFKPDPAAHGFPTNMEFFLNAR